MIVMIQGVIEHRGAGFVVLLRDGIGYKVQMPDAVSRAMSGEVTLYTHEVVLDDQRELFGFVSLEALELFWRLITISGVGPKVAQKVVAAGEVGEVKSKIMGGNLEFLSSISGIGKKTAQKIILELKGVLAEEGDVMSGDQDAVEGLIGLGYSRMQAQDALSSVEGGTTEARIRAALKRLSRA